MELLTHSLPEDCDIVVFGDTHHGSKTCSEGTMQEIINRINRKNTYCVFLGDAIDAKTVDHPHFSHEVHDARKTPLVQITEWCDIMRQIPKEKWLANLTGNHEFKLHKFGNLTKVACENLGGIPYGGFLCKLTIKSKKSGRPMFRMVATHGSKCANSTSPDPLQRRRIIEGQIKRAISSLGFSDCVVGVMGHGHRLCVVQPAHEPFFSSDGDKLIGKYTKARQIDEWIDEDLRFHAMCGSTARTLVVGAASYSELASYQPAQLGCVEIVVRGGVIGAVSEIHMGHV